MGFTLHRGFESRPLRFTKQLTVVRDAVKVRTLTFILYCGGYVRLLKGPPEVGHAASGKRGAVPGGGAETTGLEGVATSVQATRAGGSAGEDIAAQATGLIGAGCVVWRLVDHGKRLRAIAVDHRDPHRCEELLPVLHGPSYPFPTGWVGHSMAKGRPLRLRVSAPWERSAAGLPEDAQVEWALMVPLHSGRAVIGCLVNVRGEVEGPFSESEAITAVRLAAEVGNAVAAECRGGDQPSNGRASGDVGSERILEGEACGVCCTNVQGAITYANHAACELAGLPANELEGRRLTEFVDEPLDNLFGAFAAESEHGERLLRRPDGQLRWVEVTSVPLVDERGRRWGSLITFTDISDHKALEAELRSKVTAEHAVARLALDALHGRAAEEIDVKAAETVTEVLEAEYATVCEIRQGGEEYVVRAYAGWPADVIRPNLGPLPLDPASPGSLAVEAREPVIVHDLAEHASRFTVHPNLVKAGVRSGVAVAFGENRGLIAAHSTCPRAFSVADLEFLDALGEVLLVSWQRNDASISAMA